MLYSWVVISYNISMGNQYRNKCENITNSRDPFLNRTKDNDKTNAQLSINMKSKSATSQQYFSPG